MARQNLTFRVFVSSTFGDMIEERNALQSHVFPKLQAICQKRGARFQAIDLRWGVSEEASLDQQTMDICLAELKRCQDVSPRPNFIVLLGDRYGWRPLPSRIEAEEFDALLRSVPDPDKGRLVRARGKPESKTGWYRRDDNAVPPTYCLLPRTGEFVDPVRWEQEEAELRAILLGALEVVLSPGDPMRQKWYESATHQEIHQGALAAHLTDVDEHVFAFFRRIANLACVDALATSTGAPDAPEARIFVDTSEVVRGVLVIDGDARERLDRLKEELGHKLGANVWTFEAEWTGQGISTGQIGTLPSDLEECEVLLEPGRQPRTLCEAVWQRLARSITAELGEREELDRVSEESRAHAEFASEYAKGFIGLQTAIEEVNSYLADKDRRHPLLVWGASGSGKTALLARLGVGRGDLAAACESGRPDAGGPADDSGEGCLPTGEVVVARFIGATPRSCETATFLEDLIRQISRCYGDERPVPTKAHELSEALAERLRLASSRRPLVLVIDALDRLRDGDGSESLSWIPESLPEHVKVVVSILQESIAETREPCVDVTVAPRDGDSEGRQVRADELVSRLPATGLFRLPPLSAGEGAALLDSWLEQAGRDLQPEQKDKVLRKSANTGLPLYLKLAFEEARRWHSWDSPPDLPADVRGLVEAALLRLEAPQNHGRVLVSHAFGYLGVARLGLTEDELLDALAVPEVICDLLERSPHSPRGIKRLPAAVWARFEHDARPFLCERAIEGVRIIDFVHGYLREVAELRFLSSGGAAEASHRRLAEVFDVAADPARDGTFSGHVRAFAELPYHLDQAGDDEWALDRLENLPRKGFVAHKIRRAHDVRGAAADYGYFFKACLRRADLDEAIALAFERTNLGRLSNLLTSEHLASLGPSLPDSSPLWLSVTSAIASAEPAATRAEILTRFTVPGLTSDRYGWLRMHFALVADDLTPSSVADFVRALGASEDGSARSILRWLSRCVVDADLAPVLICRASAVCRGTEVSEETLITSVLEHATISAVTFQAIADSLGEGAGSAAHCAGLPCLEKHLDSIAAVAKRVACAAALSSAQERHGQTERAETHAQFCLTCSLPDPGHGPGSEFLASDTAEAIARTAQASAPFKRLWPQTLAWIQRESAKILRPGLRAEMASKLLLVAPRIPDRCDRSAWIHYCLDLLKRIIVAGPDRDDMLRWESVLTGDTGQALLVSHIEEALIGLLVRIDEILPEPADLGLLHDLLLFLEDTRQSIGRGSASMMPLFGRVVPALARSRQPDVVMEVLKFFVGETARSRKLTNDTLLVLESPLLGIVERSDHRTCQAVLSRVFDLVEEQWGRLSRKALIILPSGLLRALGGSQARGGTPVGRVPAGEREKRYALLCHFRQRLAGWAYSFELPVRDSLWISWAALLLALGRRQEAVGVLSEVAARKPGDGEPFDLSSDAFRLLLRELLDFGATEEAARLAAGLSPGVLDISDLRSMGSQGEIARLVVLARSRYAPEAAGALLCAARALRSSSEESKLLEVAALLLNRCHGLQDPGLVESLAAKVETELAASWRGDSWFAARWYLAVMLAVSGHIEQAQKALDELAGWPDARKKARVLEQLAAILLQPETPQAREASELIARLLEEVRSSEVRTDLAELLGRSLPVLPGVHRDWASDLILESARLLGERSGDAGDLLETFAEVLATFDDTAWAGRQFGRLLDLIEEAGEEDDVRFSGRVNSCFGAGFDLLRRIADSEQAEALLGRLVACLMVLSTEGGRPGRLAAYVEHALSPALRLRDARGIVRIALDASERLAGAPERSRCWSLLAQCVVTRAEELEAELEELIAKIDQDAPRSDAAVVWARLYELSLQHGAPGFVSNGLRGRVLEAGRPEGLQYQIRWLGALLGTPLRPAGLLLAEDLWAQVDAFSERISTLRELEPYLVAVVPVWPGDEFEARFQRLIDWATSQPPVQGEDWRAETFLFLLRASWLVPADKHTSVQLRILNGCAAIATKTRQLPDLARWAPAEGVVSPQVGRRFVELDAALRCETDSAYFPAALRLACGALTSGVGLTPDLADFLSTCLDGPGRQSIPVHHSVVVKAVTRCTEPLLRRRLEDILEGCYAGTALGDLGIADLGYLMRRSTMWWVDNHGRTSCQERGDALAGWVEVCLECGSLSVAESMILALEWVSRESSEETEPEVLNAFCRSIVNSRILRSTPERKSIARALSSPGEMRPVGNGT